MATLPHSAVSNSDSSAAKDFGQSCLFVANLPHRMTNEQLALALMNTFRHFGPIHSIKASRDGRGRPFGFVDFTDPKSAKEALEAAPFIHINFRQVRIELAKCQRKLNIKMAIPAGSSEAKIAGVIKAMRAILLGFVEEESLKMNFYRIPSEDPSCETVVTAILKFTESPAADRAFNELSKINSQWSVCWCNSEKENMSGIRSSGLVHIVPSKLGSNAYFSVPLFIPNYFYPLEPASQTIRQAHAYPIMPYEAMLPRRQQSEQPVFEEHLVRSGVGSQDISQEFEELSMKSGGPAVVREQDIPARVLECTLFAGRLNSQKVSKDLLIEYFSSFGPIRYVCLFNKGALSPEGIPLDAYAFVTYGDRKSAIDAIQASNGTVWLGQTMKCEPARVLPPTPSVIQLYHYEASTNSSADA